jgi:hypothetical protein
MLENKVAKSYKYDWRIYYKNFKQLILLDVKGELGLG